MCWQSVVQVRKGLPEEAVTAKGPNQMTTPIAKWMSKMVLDKGP